MNLFKAGFTSLAAIMLVATASGCTRTIVSVTDHPRVNVTLMQTIDTDLLTTRHQFWECADEAEQVVCSKICGAESQPRCLEISNLTNQSNLP